MTLSQFRNLQEGDTVRKLTRIEKTIKSINGEVLKFNKAYNQVKVKWETGLTQWVGRTVLK